jgi:hypothetical protein
MSPSSRVRSNGIVVDRHAAGFQHPEPAGDQQRLVGGAQQHAAARHQPQSRTSTWRFDSRFRSSC